MSPPGDTVARARPIGNSAPTPSESGENEAAVPLDWAASGNDQAHRLLTLLGPINGHALVCGNCAG